MSASIACIIMHVTQMHVKQFTALFYACQVYSGSRSAPRTSFRRAWNVGSSDCALVSRLNSAFE